MLLLKINHINKH